MGLKTVKNMYKKAYCDIFGEKAGMLLADYAAKMSVINEAGLNDTNLQEYTELADKFNKLLEASGGHDAIMAYNDKIREENNISGKQYKNYIRPRQKKDKEAEAKRQREIEAVARYERFGIPAEWYSFVLDPDKVVRCDKERYVYYDYDNISSIYADCKNQSIYDVMLDKLLMHKRRTEFMEMHSEIWVKSISVVNNEMGSFCGCTENGKFKFRHSVLGYGEPLPDIWKNDGYVYERYDQYMGDTTYVKTTDESAFTELLITVMVRLSEEEKNRYGHKEAEAVLKYPIPDCLREDIFNYIRTDVRQLEIQSYELFDRIVEHFMKGGLIKDAKDMFSGSRS